MNMDQVILISGSVRIELHSTEDIYDGIARYIDLYRVVQFRHYLTHHKALLGVVVIVTKSGFLLATRRVHKPVVNPQGDIDLMAGREIIRQTVIRFAGIRLKHERRIFPLGVVGERGGEWVGIPLPLCGRGTAHTVVDAIAVLHRIPPSGGYRIQIGIRLLPRSRIRRQRVVRHRDKPYRLCVRIVRFVRTLDLEHITLHQIFLLGTIDFPR